MEEEGIRIQRRPKRRLAREQATSSPAHPAWVSAGVSSTWENMCTSSFTRAVCGIRRHRLRFRRVEDHAWAGADLIAAGDLDRQVVGESPGSVGVDPCGQERRKAVFDQVGTSCL